MTPIAMEPPELNDTIGPGMFALFVHDVLGILLYRFIAGSAMTPPSALRDASAGWINGLAVLVEGVLEADPFSHAAFLLGGEGEQG